MEIEVFIQQVEQRLQKLEANPPQGSKGDPGPQGPQGPEGREGIRGLPGKPGDISRAVAEAEREARKVAADTLNEFLRFEATHKTAVAKSCSLNYQSESGSAPRQGSRNWLRRRYARTIAIAQMTSGGKTKIKMPLRNAWINRAPEDAACE